MAPEHAGWFAAGLYSAGETMAQLAERMQQALNDCLALPQGSRPVLVSHGIALGCLLSTVLGLPPYAERRLRLRNCSLSRVDYQQSAWLASGWVVETAGMYSIWPSRRWMKCYVRTTACVGWGSGTHSADF